MQIVLHDIDYSDAFSVLISLVTRSSISHASIIQDGINYDVTWRRGYLDKFTASKTSSRAVTVFDFPELDATEWLAQNMQTKYDKMAIVLWPLGKQDNNKFYCFESVLEFLRSKGIVVKPRGEKVSGRDLFLYFTKVMGKVGVRATTAQLLP